MPGVVSVFGVEPFRIGGTETYSRELSAQLREHGHHSVLCFLSKPPASVEEFLKLPNVSLEVIEDSTNSGWRASAKLASILNRYQPEVLHLHFIGFLGLYPWVGAIRSVKKIFFTDHTSRPAGYVTHRAPWWKRYLVRVINRPLTKVVCVSDYGYRCMTALDLLPKDRFEMIYNGVDLSRVSSNAERARGFRRRHGIPEGRLLVVQVSWIIPEKGIPELLRAAKLVLEKNDNVHFAMVGEGQYRQQYMDEAVRLGIDQHITWTGMVEDPFGEGVYDAADVICQLSHWEEVFGWMVAEGMAYQKPIVATRVGGIPELVRDQSSGLLVERGDINGVAEKLLHLFDSPELRLRMGKAGSDIARTKFDLRQNVAQLIRLYDLKRII